MKTQTLFVIGVGFLVALLLSTSIWSQTRPPKEQINRKNHQGYWIEVVETKRLKEWKPGLENELYKAASGYEMVIVELTVTRTDDLPPPKTSDWNLALRDAEDKKYECRVRVEESIISLDKPPGPNNRGKEVKLSAMFSVAEGTKYRIFTIDDVSFDLEKIESRQNAPPASQEFKNQKVADAYRECTESLQALFKARKDAIFFLKSSLRTATDGAGAGNRNTNYTVAVLTAHAAESAVKDAEEAGKRYQLAKKRLQSLMSGKDLKQQREARIAYRKLLVAEKELPDAPPQKPKR